jgi:hypothetical protein
LPSATTVAPLTAFERVYQVSFVAALTVVVAIAAM